MIKRKRAPAQKALHVVLSARDHKNLKLTAAREETTVRELVLRVLGQYIRARRTGTNAP